MRVYCRKCGSSYFATLPDAIHGFCTTCEAPEPVPAGKKQTPNKRPNAKRTRKKGT